jgi:hypothetical protein
MFVGAQSFLRLVARDPASRAPLLLLIGGGCLLTVYLMSGLPLRMSPGERQSFAVLLGVLVVQCTLGFFVVTRRSGAAMSCAIGCAAYGLYAVGNAAYVFRPGLDWGPAMVYSAALAMNVFSALIASLPLGIRWHRAVVARGATATA